MPPLRRPRDATPPRVANHGPAAARTTASRGAGPARRRAVHRPTAIAAATVARATARGTCRGARPPTIRTSEPVVTSFPRLQHDRGRRVLAQHGEGDRVGDVLQEHLRRRRRPVPGDRGQPRPEQPTTSLRVTSRSPACTEVGRNRTTPGSPTTQDLLAEGLGVAVGAERRHLVGLVEAGPAPLHRGAADVDEPRVVRSRPGHEQRQQGVGSVDRVGGLRGGVGDAGGVDHRTRPGEGGRQPGDDLGVRPALQSPRPCGRTWSAAAPARVRRRLPVGVRPRTPPVRPGRSSRAPRPGQSSRASHRVRQQPLEGCRPDRLGEVLDVVRPGPLPHARGGRRVRRRPCCGARPRGRRRRPPRPSRRRRSPRPGRPRRR